MMAVEGQGSLTPDHDLLMKNRKQMCKDTAQFLSWSLMEDNSWKEELAHPVACCYNWRFYNKIKHGRWAFVVMYWTGF